MGRAVFLFNRRDTAGPVAARYIDKIFKGANPADLPVEELSRTIPRGKPESARELGLTIPPSVRVRADRVIE
jgi:putative ABC transport system substrate-binding protein